MNKEPRTSEPIVPITVVSVHILIYDSSGPRAVYGGVCPLLAQALAQADRVDGSGVIRRQDVLEPLGQDIYDVEYTAVLRLRGLFSFLTYQVIDQLHDIWPSTFKYAAIVTR